MSMTGNDLCSLAGPGWCHSPWAAFDRLVMLAAGAASIDAVRCFSSTDA
jgi:hypothetical protein